MAVQFGTVGGRCSMPEEARHRSQSRQRLLGPPKPHAAKRAADADLIAALSQRQDGERAPIYKQLAAALRRAVEDGILSIGSRLPPERGLAKALHVSRTTVQAAYQELESLGYVGSHQGSGTFVRARPEWTMPVRLGGARRRFARRSFSVANTFMLDLMQAASEPVRYGFETGCADGELVPLNDLMAVVEDLFSHSAMEWVSYSPTVGSVRLRRAIAQRLLPLRGLPGVGDDSVMILTGSMQGLDLIAKLFLDPGDAVIVERPTFPGAAQVFRSYGAHLVGVPVDAGGLVVDALADTLLRWRPKLMYIQPTLQNPTGATLEPRRRREILALAADFGVPLVEDDAYGLLAGPQGPPPLRATDTGGQVIYLSTMSKILAPGLRVGYLVAEPSLIQRLAHMKQLADLHTSTLSQLLIEGWLTVGDVPAHLERCSKVYGHRLKTALAVVSASQILQPYLVPAGGMYLFCRLQGGLSAAALRARSARRDVIFAPGDAFCADDGFADHLRLCFSTVDAAGVRVGLERLVRLAAEMLA
jgi:DNA-binding transcriptional MocR family regulator